LMAAGANFDPNIFRRNVSLRAGRDRHQTAGKYDSDRNPNGTVQRKQ